MIVFGIETTCDETSVSIVEEENNEFGNILVEETLSQIIKHKEFIRVVPELASREHSKNLDYLVKKDLSSLQKLILIRLTHMLQLQVLAF